MKRLFTLLAIAALTIPFNQANAQTAACQNLTVQLDGTGNYSFAIGSSSPAVDQSQLVPGGVFTGLAAWQSFTAGVDGILFSVSLDFSSSYTPATTATVNVYSGEGTGGSLIAQMIYSNPTTFNGTTEFILDETIDLVSGNQYTVQLVDDNSDPFNIRNQGNGSLYTGGISNDPTKDLVFSTKILQRPDIDNGSTDATYGLASFGVDVSSFNCSNLGANTVTLTVTNNNASSVTCTSTVTVEDNEIPIANCQNQTVDLDASGMATISTGDIDNGSSDNCTLTLSLDITSFTCADVGTNTVMLTVEDPAGNTDDCTATVTVNDNENPDAQCQDHTLVLDGSGAATLTTGDVNNGSSDNCAINSISLSKTAFNCTDVGTNTVTLTVEDVNSNTSTCTATITVEDNQIPTITCPSNIVVCAEDGSGAPVSYSSVVGSDNCTFSIAQTDGGSLTSGSTFPVGTTNQEWTITDASTNQASCSFTITVDAKPVADFSFSPACEGETTFFTDLSTIDPSSSIATWQWDMNDGSSLIGLVDPAHVFADTGSYDVELVVTSSEGCTDTSTQAVHVGPVPSASFTVANACEGNPTAFTNTSTIDAGTLSYAWDFGDTNTSADENPSHTYAVDGTYTVTLTVTSDNGCEDVTTASVEVLDSPTALFTASTVCDGSTTTFTNLSTGGGTLTYAWDFGDSNSSTDANPTHMYASDGSYAVTLTVTNDDGCIDVHTANVTVNPLPTVDFTFSDACEGTPVMFTNTSTSGSNNWDFGDLSSSTLTNPTHTYTTFGTYDVVLVVTDANFCINSDTQQIEIFDLPDFTLTPTDVLCYGEATGNIVANPQGTPTFPWSFSLNNGTPQINDTFLDLPAGNYDVTVEDANGCEFTVSTVVSQPSDTLGIDINSLIDVACHGDASGEIDVEGTGGTAPYMYSVDAGPQQSTGMFSGLTAGTHSVQIEDANACVFDTTITLTEPDTLVLTLTNSMDLLCNGDNSGELSVAGTGGVAPYQYNLNGGGYVADSAFYGLSAGNYIVGVLDANGCTDTLHVTLTEPGILMLSLLGSDDANCFGEANGWIEVAAASGTPDYQYSINGTSFVGSGLFQGLNAGTYTLTVMDDNGCLDSLTTSIFEPPLLSIETNSSPVACFGESTGEIEVIAIGGTPGPVLGYNFSIDNGGSFTTNGGSFIGLAADEYLVVVADTNGCTASESVVISEPSAAFNLSVDVTNALCLDSASGEALLIGSGGTPTYTYSSDNLSFVSSPNFGGFAAGNYTLYSQDINGCADSVSFTVGEPSSSVNINSILTNNPACPNEASGTASVSVSGGTPGYMYSSNAGNTFQSSQILTGLNGGGHLIVVQDANGCVDSDTIMLVSPTLLDVTIDTIVGVDCEGDVNGEIHVTGTGGTPSYTYTLNGGGINTTGDFIGRTDGNYTLTVMDVNGCSHSESIVIPAGQMLPVANFNYSVSGTAVQFNNLSEYGDSYYWQFGDAVNSTDENPIHVYDNPGEFWVTLTVYNDCDSTSTAILISTIMPGIDGVEGVSFNLFPNPASSLLNLQVSKTLENDLTLEIISVSGQVLRLEQLPKMNSTDVKQVDVSSLAQGVYYLRLIGENQQSVMRFDIIK